MQAQRGAWIVFAVIASGCGSDVAPPSVESNADLQDAVVESAPAQQPSGTRYDREYPALGYSQRTPDDALTNLAARLGNGEQQLAFEPQRGYLDALLESLDIHPASQMLVFSKTSLQVEGVTAASPRAIYFNDDTYVAWVPNEESIEVASFDAELGPVFYTLAQAASPLIERRQGLCLSCHDSYSLTGGGVPRFITGSGYIGKDGSMVAHEGWILTSDRTPLRSRWGGWYVSGMHGEQVHLGNIAVDSVYDLEDLESLRSGNHANLDQLLDTSPYLTNKSDIVALLVFEHQTTVQNAIVRVNWDARQGREYDIEPLVRALLMAETPPFTDPISGTAGFEAAFAARAQADAQGRALRDLDLQTRLFRYPLSYVVHSPAFAALPIDVLRNVMARIEAELTSNGAQIEGLPGDAASRAAAWEILRETNAQLAAMASPE